MEDILEEPSLVAMRIPVASSMVVLVVASSSMAILVAASSMAVLVAASSMAALVVESSMAALDQAYELDSCLVVLAWLLVEDQFQCKSIALEYGQTLFHCESEQSNRKIRLHYS